MVEQQSSVVDEEPRSIYDMKCPRCESQLVSGRLTCRRSFFSLNMAPQFDTRIWWFEGDDGTRSKTVTSGRQTDGYQCPHCSLLVIPRMRASWVTRSTANTLQLGVPASAARALSDRLRTSSGESAELVEAIYARKRWLKWIPGPVAVATFLGWMLVFGVTTDALEGTRWDLLDLVNEHGFVGVIVVMLLGLGVATALAFLVGNWLTGRLFRRQVDRHLAGPICFLCGYTLQGLEPTDEAIRCPECGRRSPVDREARPA